MLLPLPLFLPRPATLLFNGDPNSPESGRKRVGYREGEEAAASSKRNKYKRDKQNFLSRSSLRAFLLLLLLFGPFIILGHSEEKEAGYVAGKGYSKYFWKKSFFLLEEGKHVQVYAYCLSPSPPHSPLSGKNIVGSFLSPSCGVITITTLLITKNRQTSEEEAGGRALDLGASSYLFSPPSEKAAPAIIISPSPSFCLLCKKSNSQSLHYYYYYL